jgi:thiol-disulfide isomerase/thioredoxin
MKKLLVIVVLLFSSSAFSQKDTLAPYQQFPTIPPFRIQLMDSTTWFTKANLSSKKPTWVIYFSPDCGHCQLETEEIISSIKQLQNIQIVMIASRSFSEVKNFYNHYLINRFPNIKMGVDAARFVTNFYKVEFTPFSALYDKKGRLIKAFKDAPEISEVVSLAAGK